MRIEELKARGPEASEPGAGEAMRRYATASSHAYRTALDNFLYTTFARPERVLNESVRTELPELARLPTPWIHKPWQAPSDALAAAGVELDRTYPRPIVGQLVSREVALEAYQKIRGA